MGSRWVTKMQPNGPKTGPALWPVFMFSLCCCALKTWELPHVYYKQYVAILHRNSSGIYGKCGFYCSGSLRMHVRDPQNTLHILEVCNIDFFSSHCSTTRIIHRSQWNCGTKLSHFHNHHVRMCVIKPQRQQLFFLHANLLTVLAVMKQRNMKCVQRRREDISNAEKVVKDEDQGRW